MDRWRWGVFPTLPIGLFSDFEPFFPTGGRILEMLRPEAKNDWQTFGFLPITTTSMAFVIGRPKTRPLIPDRRYRRVYRSRSALEITETELRLIAAPASIGLSSSPKNG